MSWIKRVMGFEAPTPAAGATSVAPGNPLGLASGRMLCLDRSLKLLLEGQSHVVVPDDEKVWAVGDIDLGQSMRLQRFYLDNEDYFLQVVMDGPAAEDIQDLILFGYHDVTTINSKEQLLQLTEAVLLATAAGDLSPATLHHHLASLRKQALHKANQ